MKLYYGTRRRTEDFTLFKVKSDVRIGHENEILVNTTDGIWRTKVLGGPIRCDDIQVLPEFNSYIGKAEKNIIEHNETIEREFREELISYLSSKNIQLKVAEVEINFNRTKLLIYHDKEVKIPDIELDQKEIEKILKMDVEFVPAIEKTASITCKFTHDFEFAETKRIYSKNEKIIIKKEDGIWIGNFLGIVPDEKKVFSKMNNITILGIVDENLENILKNIHSAEKKALSICREFAQKEKLEMNLLNAEYSLDERKVFFYYTAEGRIDFRTLVRQLAEALKTRIEMKQIGIRDELRTFPTIGICGQQTCCSRFIHKFEPVVLKMAKMQNLDINTEKITGICNRLLCCLRYECNIYEEFVKKVNTLPKKFNYTNENNEKKKVEIVGFNPVKETVVLKNENYYRESIPFARLKEEIKNEDIIDKRRPIDIPDKG